MLAMLVGKLDVLGSSRVRERDQGCPLASSSTLNRLELSEPTTAPSHRYKRIAGDPDTLDRLLVDVFVESYAAPPREIWLDLDATDDPLHGNQEARFFHGYYNGYCYLPLYIFCDDQSAVCALAAIEHRRCSWQCGRTDPYCCRCAGMNSLPLASQHQCVSARTPQARDFRTVHARMHKESDYTERPAADPGLARIDKEVNQRLRALARQLRSKRQSPQPGIRLLRDWPGTLTRNSLDRWNRPPLASKSQRGC